jgi:hypothetical protein
VVNHHPDVRVALATEIARARALMDAGRTPSEVASVLHAEGVSAIQLLAIAHEATGASLRDLKAFGRWWGNQGVTDAAAFDAWAAKIFPRAKAL